MWGMHCDEAHGLAGRRLVSALAIGCMCMFYLCLRLILSKSSYGDCSALASYPGRPGNEAS